MWGIVLEMEVILGNDNQDIRNFDFLTLNRAMTVVIGPDTGRKLHRVLLQTILR